ncbi:MAG: DUF167 domain-containing protein [Candidatus Micrarchaeota archaeon]
MKVEVSVVPGSGSFRIAKGKGGKLRIFLKSQPEGNKANIELIKKLSRALKCEVRLLFGMRSKNKTLELGIDEDKWASFVEAIEE